MPVEKISVYRHTCHFCKNFAIKFSDDKKPYTRPVYYFYYGGYGDGQKIVECLDACDRCYQTQLDRGYGATPETAGYEGRL